MTLAKWRRHRSRKAWGREGKLGAALLKRVLYWTGGHPYLTQRLCQSVGEDRRVTNRSGVDRHCESLFLSSRARERDDNLLFVRERMLRSEADLASLLELYRRICGDKRVPDDDTNPLISILRLSGVARINDGYLYVRNRIYSGVFNGEWVTANMPDAELRRQRAAYRRGLTRATGIAAVIIAITVVLTVTAVQQRNRAEQQRVRAEEEARRADRNFRQALSSAEEAQNALEEADKQRLQALAQETIAERQRAEAEKQRKLAVGERIVAETQRFRAEQQQQANRQLLYVAHMNLAQQDWDNSNIERMDELLSGHMPTSDQNDLRGFEWYYLWRQAHSDLHTLRHEAGVGSVAFLPDAKTTATASGDGTANFWDVTTARHLNTFRIPKAGILKLSPDCTKLAAMSHGDEKVNVFDLATGRTVSVLNGMGQIFYFEFSPDGKKLATIISRTLKLWDLETGKELIVPKVRAGMIMSVAFSPDGTRLATASVFSAQVWDAISGQELTAFPRVTTRAPVAFSPDGTRLLSGANANTAKLWDAVTGREVTTFAGHARVVTCVAFSPDGKNIATASEDRSVKVWDAATGQEINTFKGHTRDIRCLAFSADGKKIVTGSDDHTAKIWDASPRQEVIHLEKYPGAALSVAISPDTERVAWASAAPGMELWDLATVGKRQP